MEISNDAKGLGDEMRLYKIDSASNSIGIYKYHFIDNDVIVRCKDENVDIYAECILKIIDRLRELNNMGITNDKVQEFVSESYERHKEKQSHNDIFWPTIEAFSKDGLFKHDEVLIDAIHTIGKAQGYEPNAMQFIILKSPIIMSLIMSVAIHNIEISDYEYYPLAFAMLKAIMYKIQD